MIQNLSQLYTFVVAARHLSFTKTAKDLFLTQGAVSIQIKHLEEELGFKLFLREARTISLTREGQELLQTVEPALKQIQARIEAIKSKNRDDSLVVSTLPSFAGKWLIPRILKFQGLYPDINLRIHTSDKLVDFANDKIDCAIRFGSGSYPGLFSVHLVDEFYFPVCSPDLITKEHPLEKPEDIQHYQLLHDDYAKLEGIITWEKWAEFMSISNLDFKRGLQYGQSDFVIQAAIARQGIAMARLSLVGNDLQAGLLVPAFNIPVKTDFSYYFVCPEEYKTLKKVMLFKDWIDKTMKSERDCTEKLLESNSESVLRNDGQA
ncbi:transcriptional regulator GcvA [bacterium]|nr:transcriptional regulator GcvA [bacterium]